MVHSTINVKKVSVLAHRAKEEADRLKLKDNDLVIIKTIITEGKLPEYKLTKIEGNPIEFLQKIFNEDTS